MWDYPLSPSAISGAGAHVFEHARKQTGTAFGDHSAHSKAGIDFDRERVWF
jgi:hypothetical protein